MLKLLVLLTLATLTLVKVADSELCAGCPTSLTGEDLKEAEDRLSETFTKLAAGTGPTYT